MKSRLRQKNQFCHKKQIGAVTNVQESIDPYPLQPVISMRIKIAILSIYAKKALLNNDQKKDLKLNYFNDHMALIAK